MGGMARGEGTHRWRRGVRRAAAGLCIAGFLGAAYGEEGSNSEALYARFDALTQDALARLPSPHPPRADGALVWFLQGEVPVGEVSVALHEVNGLELARFDTRLEGGAAELRMLGRSPSPGPGSYELSVRYDDAIAVHSMELDLRGDERLIEVQLPDDIESLPDLTLWGDRDRGGFIQSVVQWFGFPMRIDHRRSGLRAQPLNAPDVRLASERCARPESASLDGLLALRDILASYAAPPPTALATQYARCALDRGFRQEAERALGSVVQSDVPNDELIELGLSFARIEAGRGELDRAIDILRAAQELDPRGTNTELRDRLSVLLLRAGRSEEALEVLRVGDHLQVGDVWGQRETANPTLYFTLLNYGIALSKQGLEVEAMSVFDLVAQRTTPGSVGRALSDRANHMLGWELLQRRQGREAAAAFDRVALDGPYAGGALLGRGWAMLTGANAPLQRRELPDLSAGGMNETALRALFKTGAIGCFELQHFIDTVSACRNASRFERARVPESDASAQQNAMPFWSALFARNARDPSVIEGYLAAADAAFAVGELSQGIQLLEVALDRLDAIQTRWNAAQSLIDVGAAPTRTSVKIKPEADTAIADLHWWLRDWVNRPHTVSLHDTFAATAPLIWQLRQQTVPDSQALVEDLLTLREGLAKAYKASASEQMQALRQRFAEHRINAQLGLARAYDRALGGS